MVIDLIVSTEVRVILFQGIIPVGTRTDYLFHAIAVHDFNIGLHKGLGEIFVPAPHGRIAATSLFGTENAKADTGCLKYLRKRGGYLLSPVIKRSGASDVEEV